MFPHQTLLDQARALVTDPVAAANAGPLVRRIAWAALKAARGQTLAQRRLPMPGPVSLTPGDAA